MSVKALLLLYSLVCVALCYVRKAHPCNFEETCHSHDYVRVSRASGDLPINVSIHLRQRNFATVCPSLLADLSSPRSPSYGEYLSFAEIRELTWDQEAIDRVQLFLEDYHVPRESQYLAPNGEFIEISAPISVVEKMFEAEYYLFKSASRGRILYAAESYTVPTDMEPYIVLVNGVKNFPVYSKHLEIKGFINRQVSLDGTVVPQLIWKTYKMPNETVSSPLADQCVFEALGEDYAPSDLAQFQSSYGLPSQGVKKVIGPNDPSQCEDDPDNCAEANLDVQYIMAMAQGAPLVYWSIADQNGDIFLDFIEQVAKDPTPPQVFSISYGGTEDQQDPADMQQFNIEACKMGLRGLTLFAASGDDGVAGDEARGDPSKCGFHPLYPASSPYLTAVGATMGPESGQPEVACQSDTGSTITTGGGFSDAFPMPDWQKSTVQNYLKIAQNLPPLSMFNTTGRAYPDVAALGNAYHIVSGGQDFTVDGTSCSAPVFCGMVTMVNSFREALGKKPLGFLNPLLYSIPANLFNDITVGDNCCCASAFGPTCCNYCFYCAPGWDPVTGMGSIDFVKFANYLTSAK